MTPKKQRTNDYSSSSSSTTDDFLLELEEEVSSKEEEMNPPTDSDEKLLIQRVHFDDGDTFNLENNDSIRNDREPSDDDENQFFDEDFD
jgi:hypothetical protein